jgi:uridylate kinase
MWLKSKKVVIKLSGNLLFPPRAYYLKSFRETIDALLKELKEIGIVVGGGELAKSYISALRDLGVPESRLDIVGIDASRLNALALANVLYPLTTIRVPQNIEEALEVLSLKRVVVLGGLQPGQSTNAVAASLAEAMTWAVSEPLPCRPRETAP